MAFRFSRADVVPFNSKVHTVLCVDKSLAVVVHSCVGHLSKIDKEAELVVRQIFSQIYVGSTTTFYPKEPAYLIPHVDANDALIVNPVWGTVYSDTYFGNVWIKVVFRVPSACCVGHDE